jgi:hypothetical protein
MLRQWMRATFEVLCGLVTGEQGWENPRRLYMSVQSSVVHFSALIRACPNYPPNGLILFCYSAGHTHIKLLLVPFSLSELMPNQPQDLRVVLLIRTVLAIEPKPKAPRSEAPPDLTTRLLPQAKGLVPGLHPCS